MTDSYLLMRILGPWPALHVLIVIVRSSASHCNIRGGLRSEAIVMSYPKVDRHGAVNRVTGSCHQLWFGHPILPADSL